MTNTSKTPLPPDRSHVATEQRNASSENFDLLTTLEQVRAMAHDHAIVHAAVANAAPAIVGFVDALVLTFALAADYFIAALGHRVVLACLMQVNALRHSAVIQVK